LYLAGKLMRGLGSENIDYRMRNADFSAHEGVRTLGTTIASLTTMQRVLIVGSNLRKDHPLFAQRLRQAAKSGCAIHSIGASASQWAMPMASDASLPAQQWLNALQSVATAVAEQAKLASPYAAKVTPQAQVIAKSLLSGERKAVLLGNAAAHHAYASALLAVANWIAQHTGATVGYLTEAANTVGAQFVGAMPAASGLNAQQMINGGLKAVFLLNTEPEFDSAQGHHAVTALAKAEMVVGMGPFIANKECCDVILPIAPFSETPGTFVNAEGRVQSFHAVVKPLGETRPAWKVLRAIANTMKVPGFEFESAQEVLQEVFGGEVPGHLPDERLSNACTSPTVLAAEVSEPCVARIYQLDSIVRRASALQMTADARNEHNGQEVLA
jgi:NADH-quinone oxidoreductase subunit G